MNIPVWLTSADAREYARRLPLGDTAGHRSSTLSESVIFSTSEVLPSGASYKS